jgi:broad specificity phosphatase PhoE
MQIYLVRHGQSQWQTGLSDNPDTPLTTLGHLQSRQLATWLATSPRLAGGAPVTIAALYASPLRRAQETAAHLANALGLAVATDACLSEADFHVADHLPQRGGPLCLHRPFTPSESYADFRRQADRALRLLVRQAEASGSVLAVTHGGLIKTLLRLVVGTDDVCFRLCNACPNVIEWRRGRWHLIHLNLWDHLLTDHRTE